MVRRSQSVTELAQEAGLDPEELLIRLWDLGIDVPEDLNRRLSASQTTQARNAVGLPSPNEIRRPPYWQEALGISHPELYELLRQAGISADPKARTLPKGSVKILKRAARRRTLLSTPPTEPRHTAQSDGPSPFTWEPVGHIPARAFLDAEQVERIHLQLAKDFIGDIDPIIPSGVRDQGLLESAVSRQHTSSGEDLKYPTAVMCASALMHSIVMNHPFHNGNKRTGLVCLIVSLDLNGVMLTCDESSLFQLVVRLAQHSLVPRDWPDLADREVHAIATWVEKSSRSVELGERPIQWRKLKQILTRLDCTYSVASGNRLNIERRVSVPARFGRNRIAVMSAQLKYTDDGREAQKHTIHELRRSLQLDNEHGVDSASFYGDAGRSVADFVVRYRKTLNRLAKL
jgi:prophage maintenance system killer protein